MMVFCTLSACSRVYTSSLCVNEPLSRRGLLLLLSLGGTRVRGFFRHQRRGKDLSSPALGAQQRLHRWVSVCFSLCISVRSVWRGRCVCDARFRFRVFYVLLLRPVRLSAFSSATASFGPKWLAAPSEPWSRWSFLTMSALFRWVAAVVLHCYLAI